MGKATYLTFSYVSAKALIKAMVHQSFSNEDLVEYAAKGLTLKGSDTFRISVSEVGLKNSIL